ncbi:MAG: FMN-binding protein [Clostridiales bacterium]|nr:FMN-binding protein [Clostridiales bacterium]
MRNIAKILLCLLLVCALSGCAASADERTGEAQGYGGTLKVRVTMDGEKLGRVEVTQHNETQGVGTRAIDALPDAMASAGTWDVDAVSGATVTSNALREAVRMALGEEPTQTSPAASQQPSQTQQPDTSASTGAMSGVGMTATGRIGPGTDDTGAQVYSFNVVFAHGTFDDSGRVMSLDVDQLEVATPNYDGASMPHFSGFPGQGGYALWDDAQGKVSGKTEDTDEAFLEEVSGWVSKRQRGDDYKLNTGTWQQQMDVYEQLFTGKTVDEIESWFGKFCSDETGRPLKEDASSEADQTKYAALSDEEKAQLTDVTSSATMSLRDSHGDILSAIRRAWEAARGSAS